MRTFLIVAGILLVLWIGFMAIDGKKTTDEIKGHDQRLHQLEGRVDGFDERYQLKDGVEEENPMDKAEDKIDTKEDEIDKNMEMPYEDEDTNQNTDLLPSDEPQNGVKEKEENPTPAKEQPQANASESIVAFGYVTDDMFRPAQEAFQLNLFEQAFLGEDVITAFQLK